jgi:hypothetical protein
MIEPVRRVDLLGYGLGLGVGRGFRGFLDANYDEISGTYDLWFIFVHLDGRYEGLFNATTEERFVIPIIFFGMPENRRLTLLPFSTDMGGSARTSLEQNIFYITSIKNNSSLGNRIN